MCFAPYNFWIGTNGHHGRFFEVAEFSFSFSEHITVCLQRVINNLKVHFKIASWLLFLLAISCHSSWKSYTGKLPKEPRTEPHYSTFVSTFTVTYCVEVIEKGKCWDRIRRPKFGRFRLDIHSFSPLGYLAWYINIVPVSFLYGR